MYNTLFIQLASLQSNRYGTFDPEFTKTAALDVLNILKLADFAQEQTGVSSATNASNNNEDKAKWLKSVGEWFTKGYGNQLLPLIALGGLFGVGIAGSKLSQRSVDKDAWNRYMQIYGQMGHPAFQKKADETGDNQSPGNTQKEEKKFNPGLVAPLAGVGGVLAFYLADRLTKEKPKPTFEPADPVEMAYFYPHELGKYKVKQLRAQQELFDKLFPERTGVNPVRIGKL